MKPVRLVSSILSVGLLISAPTIVLAHAGHGDEFQSEGGIGRVPVNNETDQMLHILVEPIAPAPDGSSAVMIPATALVDADGKQLVFVKNNDFYEPVTVTTGATQRELIEVTQGLTVGENLVTQGGLSLYAESRKTQSSLEPIISPQTNNAHAQADAQGIPHSHDNAGNLVESGKLPLGLFAAIGGGAVLVIGGFGALALGGDRGKKKRSLSNQTSKRGGF
ncbi:cation efflux system protein involved in nickel and cobalt tolerance (plasmid) [Chondrocystis sp. NIES-4102]|nr:cation efflux system protein involved in nickel and cobalt tolerance [Chondrocystis sp. NIES-4102]